MLMSNIFTNGLFDDFFDDAWFNRDMRKAEKKLYGHRGKNIMNTDIKEHDEGYELYMDLPGFTKDEVKVSLENDAKCAGLAEAWIGSAQAYDDAIIVVLGTGIGGAIIKNKQIHHGAHLFAGEISTLIVDYDKETNQVLTWSDIASTTALCKRAAEALAVTSIDGRRVFELANNADEVVLEVLKNFCLDIAIQLYNLQYSYDPGVICIGGGISKQPLLIKLIKEAVEIIANETNQLLKPNVTTCKFYNEANLIGALSYFLSIK